MAQYNSGIEIPFEAAMKNLKFSRRQQTLVIQSMLMQINLPLLRARSVYVKIRGFGVISTHGNRRSSHMKHMDKYNKKAWAKKKNEMEFSEKKLVF